MADTDVLIVGAGPTGLVLALWLTRAGVPVRVIDKASQAGTTSRALIIHARTLEFYRQLGIADITVAAGLPFSAVNMWVAGRRAARAPLGDLGAGLTAFPYMVVLPQDEHERLLISELARLGIEVERDTTLVSAREYADGIEVQLRGPDGEVGAAAWYLAGCDGAHSAVREILGADFPGGTYERMFYVADVEAKGAVMNHELHIALDEADFLGVFPLVGEGRGRFIGTVRNEVRSASVPLTWDNVSERVIAQMQIDVQRVHWFSTYHVHHRVASRFRRGRIFLLGDAAHIHSPVGGQGMNTGIGDAVNLAWKLADVVCGAAPASLLESYEPERIAFARRLVATTDRAFVVATRNGRFARAVRLHAIPALLPPLLRLAPVRRLMFRILSQTAIEYRRSPLSVGRAGRIRAGDRLPWVADSGTGGDNFAPLTSRTWQVHVYGKPGEGVPGLCRDRGLALHQFPWSASMPSAGLRRDAVYLLRPDGHVAYAAEHTTADGLSGYVRDRLPDFTGRAGHGYLRHTP